MKRVIYLLIAGTLILSMALAACAKTETPPSPTGTAKPTTPTTVTPTVRPTTTATSAATPQYGGIFKVINRQGPRGFYSGPGPGIIWQTSFPGQEGLMRNDDRGETVPWLATEWKFGADNKSLTITLRKGVKFHDGTDFNAAAAKYDLDQRKSGKYGDLDYVASIDIIDDYTIRLNLSQFVNTLLGNLSSVTSWMASATAVQKNGTEWAQWNPVGTGPFKFVRYDLNQRVVYTRFDGYWQPGKPYLDGVEIPIIADPTTASLAFQNRESHALGELSTKEVVDLKAKGDYNVVAPLANITILIPDTKNADSVLSNKKVREAIEYAIDSEGIAKAVGFGMWEGPKQLAASTMVTYVPGIGRKYDPAKAKQLLSEAGYPNGFKMSLFARSVTPQEPLVAVVTNLKSVGIDAMLEVPDMARYAQYQTGGWKNGLLVGAITTGGDTAPKWLQSVNGQLAETLATQISLKRAPGWQTLLTQALTAPDAVTQKKLAQDLVKMNYDEVMVIQPYVYSRGFVWHKSVENGNTAWSGEVLPKFTVADTWLKK